MNHTYTKIEFIEKTLREVLPDKVKVADISYCPIDEGYTFVLTIPDENKIEGGLLRNPTKRNIVKVTKKILKIFRI